MQAHWGRAATWAVSIVGMAIVVVAASTAWHPGSAKADAPQFIISPATQNVPLSGGTAQVDISVNGVSGMRSFQFLLRYDPGVLKNPAVSQGPFLATSGGSQYCPAPQIDGAQKGPGSLLYGCASNTSGSGASGSGVVATVTFQLAGGAQTAVVLDPSTRYLTVTDYLGNSLCGSGCAKVDGAITVSGGDPSKDMGIAPTPTGVPDTPVPTQPAGSDNTPADPASTPGPGTPTVAPTQSAPGSSPAVAGSSSGGPASGGGGSASGAGVISGGSSGAGGVSGSAGGAQAAGHAGVGKFGSGPEPQHQGMPGASVWALAAGGIALTAAGVFMRRRTMR